MFVGRGTEVRVRRGGESSWVGLSLGIPFVRSLA